jgi:hypothetical protein
VRVLWLGAGASVEGGYPLAGSLLQTLEREATEPVVEESVRTAWQRFAAFREQAEGTERTLLSSSNPEVVLSVPDLLEAARSADNDRIASTLLSPAVRALRDRRAGRPVEQRASQITPFDLEREYNRPERTRLDEAVRARNALLHVLDDFFARRHYDDGTSEGYARRAYLRRELNQLNAGDIVITTNWDTTIERTLLEQGKWVPTDGYGFTAALTCVPPIFRLAGKKPIATSLQRWPRWSPKRSTIRVLKIHGSFGWRTSMTLGTSVVYPAKIYMEHDRFLSVMPLVRPAAAASPSAHDLRLLWDKAAGEFYNA